MGAYLTDHETKTDFLNNEAIAATIIKLLRERPDRPVTIGVHGDWGAGKSSILEMIEAGLDGQSGVLCLKFNGWRFQGFEDAKIALIEGIVTGLIEKRPALSKAGAAVKDIFRRIDWLKVARKAGGLAFTAFTGIPTPDLVHTAILAFEGFVADPMKVATKENAQAAIDGIKSVLKPSTESKNVPEEIGAFRAAFAELLTEAKVEQLVVLIDDLDRCLPDTTIETLEAIRLFVFTARTAFVIAADEAMVEYAVRKHFPDLPDTTGPQTYARNYLEKLIQVPFRIPALGETETRTYVTLLLLSAEFDESNTNFNKVTKVARERLNQPWKGGALDAATISSAFGSDAPRALNALTLSDQIAPILASGARGNPRQIKRFLNTLVLRQRTADARGFGAEIKLPVLAKLMLAERFFPQFFDQIANAAAASSDGVCADLAGLEAANRESDEKNVRVAPKSDRGGEDSKGKSKKGDEHSRPESAILAEWLSSPSILAWAKIRVVLAGVDLRPYLFVAKDRKDYFGATSALGHLVTIADQLLGPKLSVQARIGELKRLAPPEAAQVFEIVRGRVIGSGEFGTEPKGIAGLTVLVRAHPTLQSNLLEVLESLPRNHIGAWVVSGWETIFKESEAVARFDRLLQSWSEVADNQMLKTAASGTLRARKGSR